MTRKLSLAALALACAASPAMASATTWFEDGPNSASSLAHGLSMIGILFLAPVALLILALGFIARPLVSALVIACTVFAVGFPLAAFAAEVVVAPATTAVVLPWGDWVVAIGQGLTAILLPVLVGVITRAIYQVAPWARLVLTQTRIEQMTKAVTDYALNATEGVVKGQALSVPVGSAVIAKAAQRAADAAPAAVVKAAGGLDGVAELVFRVLHLEDGATAANTLAPAQAMIAAK